MVQKQMSSKPKLSSGFAQKELDKAEAQFKEFDDNVKSLTLDRMNMAPKEEQEPQTKLSQKQIENSKDIWLKPKRSVSSKERFNETFRKDWEFAKEYVRFIAEHKEIGGEGINGLWTKPFPGIPAEEWDVPVNKPIWGPRYLAERIKKCSYHRLKSEESRIVGHDGAASYTGQLVVDTTVQRLDAYPVNNRKSIFMGETSFN